MRNRGHRGVAIVCVVLVALFACGCAASGTIPTGGKPAVASTPGASSVAPTPGAGATSLEAQFVDVGQGGSCCLKIGKAEPYFYAVIDAGPKEAAGKVVAELQKMGCQTIDVLVLSHPDADHTGGATALMNDYKVLEVWDPGSSKDTATWRSTVDMMLAKAIPRVNPSAGYKATWGTAIVDVLGPAPGAAAAAGTDVNDACLVMSVSEGEDGILFTGDAGVSEQTYMMAESFPEMEIYKVPHHGGKSNYYAPFVAKVDPEVSVIDVGQNSYGHPSPDVVAGLSAYGKVYRTDTARGVDVHETGTTIYIDTGTGEKQTVQPMTQGGGKGG